MVKLLAIALVATSALGGAAAGHFLRPPAEIPPPESEPQIEVLPDLDSPEVTSLRDTFIIPVLRDGQVWSHLILTLGIESHAVPEEDVQAREPLLRDGLNAALFLHASLGGFDGDFTSTIAMNRLRERLDQVVQRLLSDPNARALIVQMVRQNG